jgi:hypothetical protein
MSTNGDWSWKPDDQVQEALARKPRKSFSFKAQKKKKSNLHAEDYRDKAASEELDRQTYLDALSLGI